MNMNVDPDEMFLNNKEGVCDEESRADEHSAFPPNGMLSQVSRSQSQTFLHGEPPIHPSPESVNDDDEEDDEESRSSTSQQRLPNGHRRRRGMTEANAAVRDDNDSVAWPDVLSPEAVLRRIERLTQTFVQALAEHSLPELRTLPNNDNDRHDSDNDNDDSDSDNDEGSVFRPPSSTIGKRIVFHNMQQCRSFASILLVLSFCHSLLLARRTTTTREVYYFYVTHFRTQKECDAAIVEAANLLRVPRSSLGLYASPKGWFCGCLQIIRNGRVVLDGQALSSVQGAPITNEWLTPPPQRNFTIDCRVTNTNTTALDPANNHSSKRAKCILVIEKEGVYNRFSEDRLYDRYPCILVTGKGFPDLATRSLVHSLHHQLQLPVYGVADCNPYGMLVLHTYRQGSTKRGIDGGLRYSVPIQWLGLRPSQIMQDMMTKIPPRTRSSRGIGNSNGDLTSGNNASTTTTTTTARLPPSVFQQMTPLDRKRLEQLLDESHPFHGGGTLEHRYDELEMMQQNDYKVELEALNWLGMDYLGHWVCDILMRYENDQQGRIEEEIGQRQQQRRITDSGGGSHESLNDKLDERSHSSRVSLEGEEIETNGSEVPPMPAII